MKFRAPFVPFLCAHCREESDRFEEMFIVEEDFGHLFCSEECIVVYFRPLVEAFHRQELGLRKELKLAQEKSVAIFKKIQLDKEVLETPGEIWAIHRPHAETTYTLISTLNIQEENYYLVSCCLSFRGRPAFIVHQTLTQSDQILSFYRQGVQVNELKLSDEEKGMALPQVDEGQVKLELAPEEFKSLELKKSELLAELLAERSADDIPIESFGNYEHLMSDTIQNPDEIYVYLDRENDEIFVHFKTFAKDGTSFYYLALCRNLSMSTGPEENLMIPVLGFPTLDPQLGKFYRRGEKIQGGLRN